MFLASSLALGASCGDNAQEPTTPPPVQRPTPDARLVIITDLKGYLEPCGCTSRPLGGIDRLAARLGELADETPTAFVAAGDLFFDGADHGGSRLGEEAKTQEIWKAETLVEILNELSLTTAVPGELDFSHGLSTFQELVAAADFPLLSGTHRVAGTNADDDESAPDLLSATHLADVGNIKVGFFGITELGVSEGAEAEAPAREAATASVAALREQGATVVVGLVRGSRRDARQLTAVEGIDFIVQAGLDQAEALAPITTDGTVLLHAGRQGQGLVVLDLFRRGDGNFQDWSDWTVEVERERVGERIEDLEERIESWKRENADEDDITRQEARLASMRRELDGLLVPPAIEGNAFNARYLELPPESRRSDTISRRMVAYDRRVNQHNRRVFAELAPAAAPEGSPHFVGSQSCESCHEEAYAWWRETKHGIAYSTLERQHKEFNLSCVGCHVTGYLEPGGSTVTHNLDGALVNVGCESCHGPSSAHVAEPEADGLVMLDAPAEVCVTCHNPEHSDRFVYEAYRAMLIVPGHGR